MTTMRFGKLKEKRIQINIAPLCIWRAIHTVKMTDTARESKSQRKSTIGKMKKMMKSTNKLLKKMVYEKVLCIIRQLGFSEIQTELVNLLNFSAKLSKFSQFAKFYQN